MKKSARWLSVIFMMILLCSCGINTNTETERAEDAETVEEVNVAVEEKTVTSYEIFEPAEDENPLPVDTEPEEVPVEYQVRDVSSLFKTEAEVDSAAEAWSAMIPEIDVPPVDTVEYLASDCEEIMETRYVESIVDETNPDTFQVIETQQEVSVTEEVPTEYKNSDGYVKYAYVEDTWYEYKYSTGNIALDEQDEELALLLLNMDGSYDDYELVSLECEETPDEMLPYTYLVLYRKAIAMEQAPENVGSLTVSAVREETVLKTETVEEKIPVLLEEEVGTGEYVYSGWQELDGGLYYFNKDGEAVTGSQVIQGIRQEFDGNGVRTSRVGVAVSSQNGEIDWNAVRNAGIDYAMIRCGYRGMKSGVLVLDSRFAENVTGAREAGLTVGLYVESQAVTELEAVEEASLAVMLAGEYEISMPLCVVSGYANSSYSGRADGLSAADRTAYITAFCRTVQNAGYTPMLCVEKGWLEECLYEEALVDFPLWLVEYNSNITYTGPYTVWQYTSRGRVNGISGDTGLSISRN